MTISYPLTLPIGFDSLVLIAENVQGRNTNLYTLKEQVYVHTGDRWKINITYPRQALSTARLIKAFLLSLKGGVGTFIAGDPYAINPSGVGGTPIVNGAGQTGFVLNTSGWPLSTSNVLKAGDYIQVGTYNLHMVLTNANSDGSGLASLDIWPRLRSSPANLSSVVINNTKGLFRLEDSETQWGVDKEGLYDFALTAVEAI